MTTPLTPLSSPQYPPQSMGERIYSRAIEAERAKTFIQAIIGTFCGLSLLAGGVYILLKKDPLSGKTKATITNSSCNQTVRDNVVSYNCLLQLNYNINGTDYKNTLNTTSNIQYVTGAPINIKYNPENQMEITEDSSTKPLGIILIVIAILLIGGVWLWNYMTHRYEAVAGYGAISDVAGIFQRRK